MLRLQPRGRPTCAGCGSPIGCTRSGSRCWPVSGCAIPRSRRWRRPWPSGRRRPRALLPAQARHRDPAAPAARTGASAGLRHPLRRPGVGGGRSGGDPGHPGAAGPRRGHHWRTPTRPPARCGGGSRRPTRRCWTCSAGPCETWFDAVLAPHWAELRVRVPSAGDVCQPAAGAARPGRPLRAVCTRGSGGGSRCWRYGRGGTAISPAPGTGSSCCPPRWPGRAPGCWSSRGHPILLVYPVVMPARGAPAERRSLGRLLGVHPGAGAAPTRDRRRVDHHRCCPGPSGSVSPRPPSTPRRCGPPVWSPASGTAGPSDIT